MPEPVHVPGAETRPLVIANPAAGSGRTGRGLAQLIAAVRDAVGDLDVAETGRRGDATALAAAAARDRRPLVIGLGGDGTLDEIVNGLLGAPPPAGGGEAGSPGRDAASLPALGIVGTGTGGDFGRSLGIPHELGAYLAALAGGAERTVDVGWARFPDLDGRPVERYWINVLSAGIGGLVDRYTAAAPAFLGGRLAYAQATLRAIVTCRRVKLDLPLRRPGRRAPRTSAGRARRRHLQRADLRRRHEHRPDGAARRRPARGRRVPDEDALAPGRAVQDRLLGDAPPGARRGPLHLP